MCHLFSGIPRAGVIVPEVTFCAWVTVTVVPVFAGLLRFSTPGIGHWLAAFALCLGCLISFEVAKVPVVKLKFNAEFSSCRALFPADQQHAGHDQRSADPLPKRNRFAEHGPTQADGHHRARGADQRSAAGTDAANRSRQREHR